MPAYVVSSGEFKTTISRATAEQAASDAFFKLKFDGPYEKVKLGLITLVMLRDDPDPECAVYIWTMALVEEHGLSYHAGEFDEDD